MANEDTSNLTSEQIAAQAAQDRQDNATAVEGIEDALQPDHGPAADTVTERVPPEPGKREVVQRSPSDDIRNSIAARFKRDNEVPFDGDMTKPENLYGEFGRAPAEEIDDEPSIVGEKVALVEPAPAAAPKTRTLKVRGQDVQMTDDEILAAAQKTLAGDSYLEDARKLLEEAKEIKAERAGRDRQHPDGQSSTQDDEQDQDRQDQTRHPASDIEKVVEQIQFGDPKEAARELEKVIDARAAKQADQGHVERLFNNDLAKSKKALADFEAANPTLRQDKIAGKIMETNMYDLYREELVGLGIDEATIPTVPSELANWHRLQRIHGFAVSDTPKLLNTALDRMQKWRGTSNKPKPPTPRKEAPRVLVNVDRTTRREAIPTQPTRSVAPMPDAQRNPPVRTGSDVVAQMRKARGQL